MHPGEVSSPRDGGCWPEPVCDSGHILGVAVVGPLPEQQGYEGAAHCSLGLGSCLGSAASLSYLLRYQPRQPNSPQAVEMLELNGNEEERVIMNPAITAAQHKETLSLATLFNPPGDTPTVLSGRIVYVCVAVIGESVGTGSWCPLLPGAGVFWPVSVELGRDGEHARQRRGAALPVAVGSASRC